MHSTKYSWNFWNTTPEECLAEVKKMNQFPVNLLLFYPFTLKNSSKASMTVQICRDRDLFSQVRVGILNLVCPRVSVSTGYA
jgi:hypothetical protein